MLQEEGMFGMSWVAVWQCGEGAKSFAKSLLLVVKHQFGYVQELLVPL